MTDAKSANWYSDGAKEAFNIEDLFPVYVRPDAAGDAAEEVFVAGGRDAFLPILNWLYWRTGANAGESVAKQAAKGTEILTPLRIGTKPRVLETS